MAQSTLSAPVEIEGQGVHSGIRCRLRLLPAQAGTGICFVRTDLDGGPEIPVHPGALARKPMQRQTILQAPGNPQAAVATVEHILAVLHGMSVDNARVEMDAEEAPIWDGSAAPLADAVARVGLRMQEGAPRSLFRIERPVAFQTETAEYSAWPSERLIVTYFLQQDHPMIGSMGVSMSVDPETFHAEIAPARTFCTWEEIEYLRNQGLIRGGNADCSIVFGQDRVLNTSLRWPDEPARHKMLDLIGDLRLLGAPVHGHVLSCRGGHQSNARFVEYLRKEFAISHA